MKLKTKFSKILENLLVIFFILFLIFLVVPLNQTVFADTFKHTVSVSTGRLTVGPADLQIDYDVYFDVERPSSVQPGKTIDVSLAPTDAKVTIWVCTVCRLSGGDLAMLGTLRSATGNGDLGHTVELDAPLGSKAKYTVVPGIDVYLSTSASGTASISGTTSGTILIPLSWSGSYPEHLQLTVPSNAKDGDEIIIRVPVNIDINAGADIAYANIFGVSLPEAQLGSLQAGPVIEEKISVSTMPPAIVIVALSIVAIVITTAAIIVKKKFKSKPEVQRMSDPESVQVSSNRSAVQFPSQSQTKSQDSKEKQGSLHVNYKPNKGIKEKELEGELKRIAELKEDLNARLLENKISEDTYKELKQDLETRLDRINLELIRIKDGQETAKEYLRTTHIDKKSYVKLGVQLKNGEKIKGNVKTDGPFLFYLTDNEHVKEFENKHDPKYIGFYEEGRSLGSPTHNFAFECMRDNEYLLVIINLGNKRMQASVEYVIDDYSGR